MKSLIVSTLILGLVGIAVGVAVKASEATAPISATVTPKLITVSVTDGSVDYGILGENTTKSTLDSPVQTQTATNGSNVPVGLNIKSSDAVGGTTWELKEAAGSNEFVHKFKGGDAADWTQLPVDNTSYATLDANPAAGSVAFNLQITTPTVITDYVLKTITVTVQVTE